MQKLDQGKKLTQQAVITLINHSIYQFGTSMSVIFLNLYLWRLANSVTTNALFNLTVLFSQAITTFLTGSFAKKKGRLVVYRLGIFLTALYYFCIILTGEKIIQYYILFAILNGIAQSFYWLGYFTIVYDVSTEKNRLRYLGWNQIVMNGSKLLGPTVAGIITGMFMGIKGYAYVFLVAFIMFVLATIGSFRISKDENSNTRYYMRYLPLIVKREPSFKYALFGFLIIGFPNGVLSFIPTILLFSIFSNEQTVAFWNVIFSILSIIAGFFISKYTRPQGTKNYLIISAFVFTLSSVSLFHVVSAWTVIFYMSMYSLFKPLQANAYEAYYYSWIHKLPLKDNFRIEAVVLREFIINLGRGFGIIIFLLLEKYTSAYLIPLIILLLAVFQWGLPFLVKSQTKSISH